MKIELYKGATFVEEITWLFGYTDNDGENDFYISSSENYQGTNYRIKITDYDDTNVYDYSDFFSINVGYNPLSSIPSFNPMIIIGIVSFISGISAIIIKKRIGKEC